MTVKKLMFHNVSGDNVAKMQGYRELMKCMEGRKADESKRKGKSKKHQADVVVESFKKLDID